MIKENCCYCGEPVKSPYIVYESGFELELGHKHCVSSYVYEVKQIAQLHQVGIQEAKGLFESQKTSKGAE